MINSTPHEVDDVTFTELIARDGDTSSPTSPVLSDSGTKDSSVDVTENEEVQFCLTLKLKMVQISKLRISAY